MAIVFGFLLLLGVTFIFLWDLENNPIVEEKEIKTKYPITTSNAYTVTGKFFNSKGICSIIVSDKLKVKKKI
jgi:hypothetical protein